MTRSPGTVAQPSGVNVHNSRNIWHRSFKFRFFPKYYSSISGCALTLYVSKSLILTISWFENLRRDCLVECPVRWIRYLDNWIFQGRLRLQRPLVVLPNINQDVHRTEYCRPLSALMRTQWIRSAIWEISDRWLDDGRTTDKIFYSQMSSISKRRGKGEGRVREGWGKLREKRGKGEDEYNHAFIRIFFTTWWKLWPAWAIRSIQFVSFPFSHSASLLLGNYCSILLSHLTNISIVIYVSRGVKNTQFLILMHWSPILSISPPFYSTHRDIRTQGFEHNWEGFVQMTFRPSSYDVSRPLNCR